MLLARRTGDFLLATSYLSRQADWNSEKTSTLAFTR